GARLRPLRRADGRAAVQDRLPKLRDDQRLLRSLTLTARIGAPARRARPRSNLGRAGTEIGKRPGTGERAAGPATRRQASALAPSRSPPPDRLTTKGSRGAPRPRRRRRHAIMALRAGDCRLPAVHPGHAHKLLLLRGPQLLPALAALHPGSRR